MKAMILAAGRGERMRPLTDTLPKPMLEVSNQPLLEHHIRKLVNVGITDIVINLAWLGEKIEHYFKNGEHFGANIIYSWEQEGPLETAGGIIKALPYLVASQDEPFLVVNGDIYIDYDFTHLPTLTSTQCAHFWLVENPKHNSQGDFLLDGNKVLNIGLPSSYPSYTFSGVGLYRPSFFNKYLHQTVAPLAPLMKAAVKENKVTGKLLSGLWTDVGTPERLSQLNAYLNSSKQG